MFFNKKNTNATYATAIVLSICVVWLLTKITQNINIFIYYAQEGMV